GRSRAVPPPPPALPDRRAGARHRRAAARRGRRAGTEGGPPMKVQHVLAALPFVGILGGMFFANSVAPSALALPSAMFWVVMWVVVSAGLMAIVYRLATRDRARAGGDRR